MKLVALILLGLLGQAFLIGVASVPTARMLRRSPRARIARVVHVPTVDRVPAVWVSDDVELPIGPPPPPPPVAHVAKPVVAIPPALRESDVKAAFERRIEELPICRLAGGASGRGTAHVTFSPQGGVIVRLSEPFVGTPAGACVARRLGAVAAPYQGSVIDAEVTFSL